MTMLTTSIVVPNLMLQLFILTSGVKADTGVHCDPGNAKQDQQIMITNTGGSYQASPNEACVTHNGKVHWEVADQTWNFVTVFVDDSHSPFKAGHRYHDKNNKGENVQHCSGKSNCPYTYYGLVIDGAGVLHVIDPKVIINPNAVEKHGRRGKKPGE